MGYKKGQKITDPNVLARLQKAREKALETRRANAVKRKEAKELAKFEKREHQVTVQKKLKAFKEPAPIPEAPKVDTKPPKHSEEKVKIEGKAVSPPRKKKKQKKVRYVEESSSSSEEEVVVRRRRRPRRRSYHEPRGRSRNYYEEEERPPPPPPAPPPPVQKPPPPPQKSRRDMAFDNLYSKCYGNTRKARLFG